MSFVWLIVYHGSWGKRNSIRKIITEYPSPVHSKREFIGRYAERDRLQAMFAGAVVLAAIYSKNDYGNDSGSRHAMGKAAEYGVPRYVIYDAARDAADPMYNLSREEIRTGAKAVTPSTVDAVKLAVNDEQLELNI